MIGLLAYLLIVDYSILNNFASRSLTINHLIGTQNSKNFSYCVYGCMREVVHTIGLLYTVLSNHSTSPADIPTIFTLYYTISHNHFVRVCQGFKRIFFVS